MQVRVNNIGFQFQRGAQRCPRQQHIEREFVARRSDFIVSVPRRRPRANDFEFGQVAASVIGYNRDALPAPLQDARLFENAHVAAIVPKERRRGDHEDVIVHKDEVGRMRDERKVKSDE